MLSFLLPLWLVPVTIIYVIYQRHFHSLAKIPGPFWASLTRLWLVKHSRDGKMHRTLIALHEKHGKLVRTGPNEVSVADPGAIKIMYGAGTKFRKSDIYSVFQGHRKFDIFPERDEKIHGAQRKLVARAYAMDCMKDLEPYVNDAIRFFLNCMDQMKEESIDMGNWFQLFAFDVIGELTFSQSFGFMKNGQDDGTFKSIKDAIRSGAWVGQIPSLYWIHDRLMPYIGNHLSINIRNGSLRTFTANAVSARKARGSDRKDVLAKLFAVHEEKPAEFNYDAIVSMASSNVTAGSDTTAISLRGILYHLLRTPHCMERLVEEIDSFRAQGKISDPVSLNEADGMPYLQAVMYEGLRLHPAIGFTLPRVVPEGGVEIDGHSIPAGTVAGASAWVIHRNKEVYGEDAEAFRPERWLDGNVGDKKRFFFSFGGGARLCIGKNISWLEMSKLIPTLLMHYDVKLTDPTKEWEEDCCFFVLQTGFDVRLKPRMMQV